MPCYDPQGREDDRHNSGAAQLLCELLTKLQKGKVTYPYWTPQLIDWWFEHQKRDGKRGL